MVAGLRRLLALAAGIVVLTTVFFATHWLLFRPPDWGIKVGGTALVAVQSVAALLAARRREGLPPALLPGAALLIGLGVYGIAGQLDPRNPDPEGYILVTSLALVGQGLLTLVLFAAGRRRRVVNHPG